MHILTTILAAIILIWLAKGVLGVLHGLWLIVTGILLSLGAGLLHLLCLGGKALRAVCCIACNRNP